MEHKKENKQTQENNKTPNIITSSTSSEIDSDFEQKEKQNQERVEAALFIAGKFLSLQDLVMLTDINPIMLKELLKRTEKKYSQGAIRVINKNNNWKMDVAEQYQDIVNKLATGEAEFSKAEQETLAIIAYKQPIKQSVIIKIRGNKAYDHIKRFIEMGLLRAKPQGHTKILELSEDFYNYFNIQNPENTGDFSKYQESEENKDNKEE